MSFNYKEKEEEDGYFNGGRMFYLGHFNIFIISTFGEFMDRLEGRLKSDSKSLLKYWPISIWSIYWNGIKDEGRYGRVIPRPTDKKGGQIEE